MSEKLILTDEIEAYIRLNYNELSIKTLSEHLHVSDTTVRKWMIQLKIPFRLGGRGKKIEGNKEHFNGIFNPHLMENWLIY